MRALRYVAVLLGFCKILDIVKLNIVKTTITILSQTPSRQHVNRNTVHARSALLDKIEITDRNHEMEITR